MANFGAFFYFFLQNYTTLALSNLKFQTRFLTAWHFAITSSLTTRLSGYMIHVK
jgi:hypothetical protein